MLLTTVYYAVHAICKQIGMPFTSIRPTYIYGPLNYNPLEEWFFERLDQVHLPVPQVVSCAVAGIAMLLGCVTAVVDCYEAVC
jgi:nucleoside-diphosphate-sugar epimerase